MTPSSELNCEDEMMGMKMAFFPYESMNGKVSGRLVQGLMHQPSMDGSKVYLNGNPDLSIPFPKSKQLVVKL